MLAGWLASRRRLLLNPDFSAWILYLVLRQCTLYGLQENIYATSIKSILLIYDTPCETLALAPHVLSYYYCYNKKRLVILISQGLTQPGHQLRREARRAPLHNLAQRKLGNANTQIRQAGMGSGPHSSLAGRFQIRVSRIDPPTSLTSSITITNPSD